MAGADVAGIDAVVVEVLARQHPVLVADQAVLGHRRRVELDLHLDVAGDRRQRRAHLADQHLLRFHQRVDVAVGAVAGIGDALHQLFVVVAGAEAQRGQRDAALPALLDQALELFEVGDADVEVAVGGQQDAVDAAVDVALARHPVGQLDAAGAGGAAAGLQRVDGVRDARALGAGRGLEHHPGAAGIGHQRDPVLRAQPIHHQLQGRFQQRQLVRRVHRTRDIHQKHQIDRRQRLGREILALERDPQQQVAGVPRAGGEFGVDRKGLRAGGARIVVREVVDHFLDPHRVLRRQLAGGQHAADVGVAAGIDVDAEGGHRIGGGQAHRIVVEMLVALAVGELRRAERLRRGQYRLRHSEAADACFGVLARVRRRLPPGDGGVGRDRAVGRFGEHSGHGRHGRRGRHRRRVGASARHVFGLGLAGEFGLAGAGGEQQREDNRGRAAGIDLGGGHRVLLVRGPYPSNDAVAPTGSARL